MYSRPGERILIHQFLCIDEAERVFHTLRRLSHHDTSGWALAGGMAVEIHCLHGGRPASTRPLNDIDFVAPAFDYVPETLAHEFLFRHVHPFDPPGKTILQFIDRDTALRIDLFRAYGAMMARTLPADLPSGPIRVISLEDTLARTARLVLDLGRGTAVPAKHANDYLRLAELIEPLSVEAAWQDHRKPGHPLTFRQTNALVQTLFAAHGGLPITPAYSKDTTRICPRCVSGAPFQLADAKLVLSLLGYC